MSKMNAMIIDSLGGSDVFKREQRDIPSVKAGHILISVRATSVNPLDTMLRSTSTPWSENLPHILHGDVAGVVTAIGADVTDFNIGDEVYGCAGGIAGTDGALAEYMLVDADLMAHKPKSLTMKEAAALPLVALTAWEALVEKIKLAPNEHILVHGGTGGVGHIAVQLAKHLGAKVSTTVKTRNVELAANLSADNVINVDEQSVGDYVEQLTGNNGFDVIFDTIAGDNINNSFEAVRPNGQIATVLPIADPLQIALKGLSFHSVLMLIPLTQNLDRARHGKILTKVAQLVDAGAISPLLDTSDYAIWQVAEAHDRYHSGQAVGKIALTMKDKA